MNQPRVLSTSTLTGDDVVNREEAKLGNLKDLMIDLDHGRIAYAVLSRGGLAGLGEKLFAVPWVLFEVDGDSHRLILDLSEDVLDNSPGFDPDHWPSFGDREWATQVHEHYGLAPYWT
ncbi:MAG TPA: PRC-barrel domain-containing protein [Acidimicrobiia bacterium]|nr:PRC-barrel domain-containing protein [Acidimicrobiia bacterium]